MPKIIENVREQLLAEAKRQIAQQGYANTTIRSVAGACGLGVGTVYNYFKSKEILIATFVLEDWKKHLKKMASLPEDDSRELLRGIYNSLVEFEEENKKLFSDSDAVKLMNMGFAARHKMLRDQIAAFILSYCQDKGVEDPFFTAQFIAEALINWSMEEIEFERLYPLLEKLL